MGNHTGNLRTSAHAYGALQPLNMAESGSEEVPEGRITFADLGIPRVPELQDTILGKARKFQDTDVKERLYIFVSLLMLLATFSFTIYKISTVSARDPDFTFALVLLVSTLFSVYYTLHGVLQERATEILVLCIATFVVLVYLIVNYAAGKKGTVKLVRLIVAALFCPFLISMGLYLSVGYYRSGNLIFRMVGASAKLQNMCHLLFIFFDLLKFDLQLSISMVILILTTRHRVNTEDIIVLPVGGVITIAWFILAYACMKRENKLGAIFFFIFSPLQVGYVVYKFVQAADDLDHYSGLAGSTIACGTMALVVRAIIILVGVFVFRNFNKGLKEKAFGIQSDLQIQTQEP